MDHLNPDCIAGIPQLAVELKVSITAIHNYIDGLRYKNHPFPKPVKVIGRTQIFHLCEVKEWAKDKPLNKGGAPVGNRNSVKVTSRGWYNG